MQIFSADWLTITDMKSEGDTECFLTKKYDWSGKAGRQGSWLKEQNRTEEVHYQPKEELLW